MEALDHPGQRVAARPTLAAHAAHAASPLREIGNCFRDAPTPLWDLPTLGPAHGAVTWGEVLSHGATWAQRIEHIPPQEAEQMLRTLARLPGGKTLGTAARGKR